MRLPYTYQMILPAGTYSITPDNTAHSFIPASREVQANGAITGMDFTQSPVHLVAPEHAYNVPLPGKSITLDWDPVAGATKYKVMTSTNGGVSYKTTAAKKPSQTSHKLKLSAHKVYYWKVQVQVGGVWKESTAFRLQAPYPPNKVKLVLPKNAAKAQPLKPAFQWKNSKPAWPAHHYVLQLKAPGGTWTDYDTITTSDVIVNYTPASDLLPNTKYQWRVNACNDISSPGAQCSGFSGARKFTTGP